MKKQFTYDEDIFSDLYKDANGFRPRGHRFYHPETTPEEKQAIWDATLKDLERELEYEHQREAEAVTFFEGLIAQTMQLGAATRDRAIQWLMDAEEHYYDEDDLRWAYGLPWKYQLLS